MFDAPNAPALADPTAPQRDGVAVATAPTRTGRLLGLVRKLIDYGKHLIGTLDPSTPVTQVASVGRTFGTIDIGLIIARVMRGLHLAVALHDRLIRNADRLDKLPAPAGAAPSRKPQAAPLAAPSAQHTAPPVVRRRRRRKAGPRLPDMPTAEEIAAHVLRRPIGAIIAEICRDLGIDTSHKLWEDLAEAVRRNSGSWVRLMKDLAKRVSRTPLISPDTVMAPPMPPKWWRPAPLGVVGAGGVPP
jgi:hypothetical protein